MMPAHAKATHAKQSDAFEPAADDAESLAARALNAEQERDAYRSLAQRLQADFENYQKRLARELADERRYAIAPLVLDLLPTLDNLERALNQAQNEGDRPALIQGVSMVRSQLLESLARHGVIPIDTLGQPFDPNLHEAILQQPREGVAPGTVVEVLESGYRLHDRVLRPTKVIVAG
jgi:molecular chaperone GrpE